MPDFVQTKVQVQPVLKLYLDLSKTNYLHFGMWDEGAELNLLNFQKAQENYAQTLISLMPSGVKTILDVGCGVGGNAIALTKAGFKVESMSPDPYQQELFTKNSNGKIQFYLTTLENFTTDKKYDLMLCSESVQYIAEKDILTKADQLLNENGYLLASDYYKYEASRNEKNLPGHPLSDFLNEAERQGFKVVKELEITDKILPTLDYGNIVYRNYIKPVLDCILTTLEVHLRPIHWILMQLLKIRINGKSLKQTIINNVVPLDRDTFKKHLTYRIHLLQKIH
ncbi:methyltransferase domain-containing protein [Candidatus Saganbacteria bacterium]|nr:methyltransferase domain-containing protein [Candidatus Saganbacteria bacterium]